MERLCKKCGVAFDGERCKPCKNTSMKAWRDKNPEVVKAYRAARRAKTPGRYKTEAYRKAHGIKS